MENTGGSAATDVVCNFYWDSDVSYINLTGPSSLSFSSLPGGETRDFYFNVEVSRDPLSYNQHREYHIEASAFNAAPVSTSTDREVFVELLVSQNRNAVTSFTGPTDVWVGQTYEYVMTGSTATNGYEQLENFINFPNTMFNIVTTFVEYGVPTGATKTQLYADACGWENDITSKGVGG